MALETNYDAIVFGAGVVGCAMAHTLGRDGRKVLLLERDMSEPDRIVGELMQPGGIKVLERLGLVGCVSGIDSVTNLGYLVINGEKSVHLKYPGNVEGEKPRNWGKSFHYGRFVMKLREACRNSPNVTLLEATVNDLLTDPEEKVYGVLCTKKGDSESSEFYAPLTFVIDGCFSKFRKEISHREVTVSSHFVGAILHDCPLPMPGHGHVVLADPSPILLYQIGSQETRVLVDVPGKVPSAGSGELKKYMLDKVMPQLPHEIKPSFMDAITKQRLRVMPSSYLPSVLNERKGLAIIGDALNMRHPLTGGGMTVGLSDVALLTELLNPTSVPDFHDHELIIQKLQDFHWRRKSHSTAINVLANALYALFSAPDWTMKALRESCFAYFELGGKCAEEPMGLLSGLLKSPMHLYLHFFAVAFYAMFLTLSKPHSSLSLFLNNIENNILSTILHYIGAVLSLPINLIIGLQIVWSAAIVIFPLITKESLTGI